MTSEEKFEINKKIKNYDGGNSFILSLKSQLKKTKYLKKEVLQNGKLIYVLSDKQYETALAII